MSTQSYFDLFFLTHFKCAETHPTTIYVQHLVMCNPLCTQPSDRYVKLSTHIMYSYGDFTFLRLRRRSYHSSRSRTSCAGGRCWCPACQSALAARPGSHSLPEMPALQHQVQSRRNTTYFDNNNMYSAHLTISLSSLCE